MYGVISEGSHDKKRDQRVIYFMSCDCRVKGEIYVETIINRKENCKKKKEKAEEVSEAMKSGMFFVKRGR